MSTAATAQPLCLTVTLRIRQGAEEEASRHLRELARQTRQEPGNLVYNAHRSLEDPQRFLIYELYRDEAALEAHRATPHFAAHATGGLYPLVEERNAVLYAPVAVPAGAAAERASER